MNRTITVAVPGSCGELAQGVIDGVDFHISCPINIFSRASLVSEPTLATAKPLPPKAALAAGAAARLSGRRNFDTYVELESDLESGKGMAGSTADIIAVASAVGLALGDDFSPEQLALLALAIEPTDGTLFNGIVAFDHIDGRLLKALGPAPELEITYIDHGGMIDTIAFNRDKAKYSSAQLKVCRLIFELSETALKWGDWRLLGMATTLSARLNQDFLPKEHLEELIYICGERGGYGVVAAHSGTVAGILHERGDRTIASAVLKSDIGLPVTVRLIGGGRRVCV